MKANKKTVEALESALARARAGKIQTVVIAWSDEVVVGKPLRDVAGRILDVVIAPDSPFDDTTIESSEEHL